MKKYALILLVFAFFSLSLIHFNWAIGGEWGLSKALPINEQGIKLLNPTPMDSLVVGLGLLIFGLFYLLKTGVFDINLPRWILSIGGWGIPVVFILRAVGDFKYIGFFKQIRDSEFGKLDTIFYSPLCLLIGIIGVVVVLRLKTSSLE